MTYEWTNSSNSNFLGLKWLQFKIEPILRVGKYWVSTTNIIIDNMGVVNLK